MPDRWSADGSRLFFWTNEIGEEGIAYSVAADGSGAERVTPTPGERPDGRYVYAPDGRRVAFLRLPEGALWVVDAAGVEQRQLAREVQAVSVSPDGRHLALYRVVSPKVARLSLVDALPGEVVALGTGEPTQWSSDGSLLSILDGDSPRVYDVGRRKTIFVADGFYNTSDLLLAPDGRHGAFSGADGAIGDDAEQIHVVDLETGVDRNLGVGYLVDSWSPDSRRIAYVSNEGIAIIGRDGGRPHLFLPEVSQLRFSPDWSRYAFAAQAGRGLDLYIASAATGQAIRVGASQCVIWERHCVAGSSGADRLAGTPRGDVILGGLGNDVIGGGRGSDSLDGEFGNDTLRGGPGDDRLIGGAGSDRLDGGPGDDSLASDGGTADTLIGGPGDDRIDGRFADITVFAGGGDDTVFVSGDGRRTAVVHCGPGHDLVYADRGDHVAPDCEETRYRPR